MWKSMLRAFALIVLTTGNANATVVGLYTAGEFLGPGTIENLHDVEMTAFSIDLTSGIGAVWNNASRQDGLVLADQLASGTGSFVATFTNLNVLPGQSFNFIGLIFDGTNDGVNITDNGGNTLLDGSEVVRMIFADGSTASAFLPVGRPLGVTASLELDSGVSAVPLPSALSLMLAALVGLAITCSKRAPFVRPKLKSRQQ